MNSVKRVKVLSRQDGNIEITFHTPTTRSETGTLEYLISPNSDSNRNKIEKIKNTLFQPTPGLDNHASLVFNDIHPLESKLDFYFSYVEVTKERPPNSVQDSILFKLKPQLGKFMNIENALVNVSQFTLSLDRFMEQSRVRQG